MAYETPSGDITAVVTMRAGQLPGALQAILFRLTVSHCSANVRVTTLVRANSSGFRQEASEILAHVRAIRVLEGGAVAGQVAEWDGVHGKARVRISQSLFVPVSRDVIARRGEFSAGDRVACRIEKRGEQQFAVDLQPIERQ